VACGVARRTDRPRKDRAEAERHPFERRQVDRGRKVRVRASAGQVRGHRRGTEGDRDDEQQQREVQEQQESVGDREALEQGVVIHPGDTDDKEADDVRSVRRPVITQLVAERTIAGSGHGEVQREECDRHGEHTVAECFQPRLLQPASTKWA